MTDVDTHESVLEEEEKEEEEKEFRAPKEVSLLKSVISFLASIFFVGLLVGMKLSALFMVFLLIHEMGHVIAAKFLKLRVTRPFFIPFIGAQIRMLEPLKDASKEAILGIGGPLFGLVSCLVGFTVWTWWPDTDLFVATTLAVFINFFNLVPARPFDGGRIAQAIGGWTRYVGIVVVGWIILYLPILLLFKIILGVYAFVDLWDRTEDLPWQESLLWAGAYLVLLAELGFLLFVTEPLLPTKL